MGSDEQTWIENAFKKCEDAGRAKSLIMLIRRQDCNGEADVVVTNATGPDVALLAQALVSDDDDDE